MVLIAFNNVFWGWIDVHLTVVVTLDPVTKYHEQSYFLLKLSNIISFVKTDVKST